MLLMSFSLSFSLFFRRSFFVKCCIRRHAQAHFISNSQLCVCMWFLVERGPFQSSTNYSSLVWRRWFIPYFIVELDSVFKGIVLLKAAVRARQLLHSAPYCKSGWLSLALGDWSTCYATSDIGFSSLDLGLFLWHESYKKMKNITTLIDTYIEPFIFFGDPAWHHVVMGVLRGFT